MRYMYRPIQQQHCWMIPTWSKEWTMLSGCPMDGYMLLA